MRSGRPLALAQLERDRMHRVAGDSAARTKAARSVLRQARARRMLDGGRGLWKYRRLSDLFGANPKIMARCARRTLSHRAV